jgi:hypothetical protein
VIGQPISLLGVLWGAFLLQTWVVAPRLRRESPAPARFYLGEQAEIALVVLLSALAPGLWLTRASSEWAAVLGLIAVALVVKIAACRWEPSKDPADYR